MNFKDLSGNTQIVEGAGRINIQAYTYDAFGNATLGGAVTNFQYKGEDLDDKTGLYFMRARYYDPATGGFISKDPVEGILANPQTQNGYNFTYANPINLSDPSQKKFGEKYHLNYPLLSDENKKVVNAYGVWSEKSMFGKKHMGTMRTSFLINPQGEIKKVYEKANPLTHLGEVLKDIHSL